MTHVTLAPANYKLHETRIPSKNCMLRMRKTLRSIIWRGWQELAGASPPYKMQGPRDEIKLPLPTALDRNGIRITPKVAVQLRAESKHQRTLETEWLTQPTIDTSAYEHTSSVCAQDKVDRR